MKHQPVSETRPDHNTGNYLSYLMLVFLMMEDAIHLTELLMAVDSVVCFGNTLSMYICGG